MGAKLLLMIAGPLLPYILLGLVGTIGLGYAYFQFIEVPGARTEGWNAGAKAQGEADAKKLGIQETLANVARSEANACWDAVGQQNAAKAKVASTTDKVQSAVAASLRADAEKQRIAAARAKAQAEQAQIEADHWRNVAATSPKDQTREQACAQAESILDENLKRRRTP